MNPISVLQHDNTTLVTIEDRRPEVGEQYFIHSNDDLEDALIKMHALNHDDLTSYYYRLTPDTAPDFIEKHTRWGFVFFTVTIERV